MRGGQGRCKPVGPCKADPYSDQESPTTTRFRHQPQGGTTLYRSENEAFTGLPVDVDDGQTHRWAAILVKAVFAILVVGVVLAAILWPSVSADVGALVMCIALWACRASWSRFLPSLFTSCA